MIKVGHAFSDYVTEEKMGRRPGGKSIFPSITHLMPIFALVILFSFLLIRLFYLQVLRGAYYRRLADSNRTHTKLIASPRGILFDRKNRPLVRNSPAFKVTEKDKNGKTTVTFLSKDEALTKLSDKETIENDVQRDYLYKDAFAHVVGYVGQISEEEVTFPEFTDYGNSDFVGKMGVEKQYEILLHGKNGKELYEVDAQGKIIRFLGKEEEVPGKNITTTLDIDVQLAVVDAMKGVEKGAVVVSDPRDGGILALYSKPSFDPNVFTHSKAYQGTGSYQKVSDVLKDTDNQPFLDRTIAGTYPPGSTFKLITAIAALEKGAIKPDTQIDDTGVLKVGEFSFGNWFFLQYGRRDGLIDVVSAIKRSNDIFFYKAAEGTGANTIALWARNFGLGERLGIDLGGELPGTVPDADWKEEVIGEQWYLGDTYHLGIGQGYLLTTPLQVNFWTLPFANNGILYKPHLVMGNKQILKKNFIQSEYRDLVRRGMMESCEQGGVAWPFFNFRVKNDKLPLDNLNYSEEASGGARFTRVKVGCKTGTAETTEDKDPHAWISVFAPFYDPEVVVTVLAENSGEGSSIAGPVAKKILEKYFEKKNN